MALLRPGQSCETGLSNSCLAPTLAQTLATYSAVSTTLMDLDCTTVWDCRVDIFGTGDP
jgi:lambda repressor-like predicted transcriptional regulator